MAKKRSREADGSAEVSSQDKTKNNPESDEEDFDMIDVDFEWFNFDADVDFHGTKSLLQQLFDVDNTLFHISGLADLILSQPTIGSTVKVDGKATDAYAMVTALNTAQHTDNEALTQLLKYIEDKAAASTALAPVAELVRAKAQVGLVFSERLINMPAEIAPPLYSMLLEEVEAAVEDGEPYAFTHYLLVSKVYTEIESTLDGGETERRRKRTKGESSTFYFHPEDEFLEKHASAVGTFAYTKEDEVATDSKRAFQEAGIKPQGYMMLFEADKFAAGVKAVNELMKPPA